MSRLSDFHIHPDYSIDATGSIREYCDKALELGLEAICFTSHYDCNPARGSLDGWWIENSNKIRMSDTLTGRYIDGISKAAAQYIKHGLRVLCGLEIDYFKGVEDEVERLKSQFPLDFLMGSVHCLRNISISDKNEAPPYFKKYSFSEMADDYFDLLDEISQCRLFDSIGHLDYYIRYAPDYYGDKVFDIAPERYDKVFESLVKNGIGIEINTSQFKRGGNDFHPSKKILKQAIGFGVKISSVGSDAHKPSDLGKGVAEAYEFLNGYSIRTAFPRLV